MVYLFGPQKSQLTDLANSHVPLWGGVPPEKADNDLSYFIHEKLVIWVSNGYRITQLGRAALNEEGRG